MSTERDTHFQNTAKLLWQKMKQHRIMDMMLEDLSDRTGPSVDLDPAAFERDMQSLLAQSIYDLVYYTVDTTNVAGYEGVQTVAEIVKTIPDLTA
jgi:hypothetical protein